MKFKEWINEGFGTGCKLGLYAPLDDALGQYPPLYATARSADLITYIDLMYGAKGVKSKGGIVTYDEDDPRHKNVRKR